jgi:hypothetical protein
VEGSRKGSRGHLSRVILFGVIVYKHSVIHASEKNTKENESTELQALLYNVKQLSSSNQHIQVVPLQLVGLLFRSYLGSIRKHCAEPIPQTMPDFTQLISEVGELGTRPAVFWSKVYVDCGVGNKVLTPKYLSHLIYIYSLSRTLSLLSFYILAMYDYRLNVVLSIS